MGFQLQIIYTARSQRNCKFNTAQETTSQMSTYKFYEEHSTNIHGEHKSNPPPGLLWTFQQYVQIFFMKFHKTIKQYNIRFTAQFYLTISERLKITQLCCFNSDNRQFFSVPSVVFTFSLLVA